MIEALMYSMLLWMGANCAAIYGIHPKHNPCQYNYNVNTEFCSITYFYDLDPVERWLQRP